MPSLQTAKAIALAKNNNAKTVGQIHKDNSDFAMEFTWDNDVNSKKCYIYDYKHDDEPSLNIGMTYENTKKTLIDAKIMVSSYGSISKDQPTLHCMFKPSQKEYFEVDDELYYLEDYRKRYHMEDVFVGLYLDIPDKKGVYHKHLICMKDVEQNFQKYFILPCDYKLQWITEKADKRIKREMWCVMRSQSSYNSGLWTNDTFTETQNQEILFIPTNDISDEIYYISENSQKNQRVILDSPNYAIEDWTPNTWLVSKVERVNAKGRTRITLYQTHYNKNTDYIEYGEDGTIIGMWANYFDSTIPPADSDKNAEISPYLNISAFVTASSDSIKVNGSYRTVSLILQDENQNNLNSDFANEQIQWNYSIDGKDATSILEIKPISFDQLKVKFVGGSKYLGNILEIRCTVFKEDIGYINSNNYQLEII